MDEKVQEAQKEAEDVSEMAMTELGNKDEEITELSDQLHSVTRDLDSKTSEVTKLSKQLEELLVFQSSQGETNKEMQARV